MVWSGHGFTGAYEDPNEDSRSIYNAIKIRLEKHGLQTDRVSAYSAASVNYGVHKAVYKALADCNKHIIKAGCSACTYYTMP